MTGVASRVLATEEVGAGRESFGLPSMEEFLEAPVEAVARVAPSTMIYAAGGTRRSAALAGVPMGDAYAHFLGPQIRETSAVCFRLGVRHLIAPIGRPQIFAETGIYRRDFCRWVHLAVASAEALAYYRRHDWQVRLVVAGKPRPELTPTAELLEAETRRAGGPRLWILTTPDYDEMWQWILESRAGSRQEAVRRLFGEHVPPAELLVSFGKPLVALDHLPPILFEETQCYWLQKPGYSLADEDLRAILYDQAYLRRTWKKDKTGREQAALAHRELWERGSIVGLGQKVGPFWYPAEGARRWG